MAVYTPLSDEALQQVVATWALPPLVKAQPIPQGSINTNYRLVTQQGPLFLRHTTVRSEADLAFEAALLEHLHVHRVPAPTLLRTAGGEWWSELLGGRVSLFGWLAGEELTRAHLTPSHLEELGRALARCHRATESFGRRRDNPYGPSTVRAWVEGLLGRPEPELSAAARLLAATLEELASLPPVLEPMGVIHADLFMDNVKWLGERVSALFDFEMACHDAYGLDVAVTLNAWCFEGGYRTEWVRALMRGYVCERPLGPESLLALHRHARYGAVRFTASRIRDFHLSGMSADQLAPKDWRTYLARVRALEQMGEGGFRQLLGV
jgi:homoserine kinase type II